MRGVTCPWDKHTAVVLGVTPIEQLLFHILKLKSRNMSECFTDTLFLLLFVNIFDVYPQTQTKFVLGPVSVQCYSYITCYHYGEKKN